MDDASLVGHFSAIRQASSQSCCAPMHGLGLKILLRRTLAASPAAPVGVLYDNQRAKQNHHWEEYSDSDEHREREHGDDQGQVAHQAANAGGTAERLAHH